MRPSPRRPVAAAAVALAVTATLAGCSSSPSVPTTTATTTTGATATATTGEKVIAVTYKDGQITPPPEKVVVPVGGRVRITVTSDVADEVHNHVTDQEQAVQAGGTVTFDFVADKPGVYEVELHDADKVLLQLQVQ